MGIIYIITLIVIIVLFLLLKKTNKKENIIFWVFLSLILVLCYNTFICYLLSLIKVKCSLEILSVINIIIIVVETFLLKKFKEFQKYCFKWIDIITMLIILLITLFIGYQRFGSSLDLRYESSDPATHYAAAKHFYEDKLLLKYSENPDKIFDYNTFMPAAYINTGIAFDIVSPYMNENSFSNVFILFDIYIWFLESMMFYLIITKCEKKLFLNIVAIIFTVLFTVAYPLNSMLFGFSYLSFGLLIIEAIIATVPLLKNKEIQIGYIIITGFLLNFTLFFSYYLFVPIIYTAIAIYFIINLIQNKEFKTILKRENILIILFLFIIPTILGFCYFLLEGLMGKSSDLQAITSEGYIYRNLLSNFIIIGPLIIYYIFETLKNKKNEFENIALILSLLFILMMLIGVVLGKISSYYYYKIYFCLWIFAMIATYKSIQNLEKNKNCRTLCFSYIIIILLIHFSSIIDLDNKLKSKNEYINQEPIINAITHIYSTNRGLIKNNIPIYNNEQIEIIKYCESNIFSNKNSIKIYANNLQQRWLYAIYGITDKKELKEFSVIEQSLDIENWIKSDKKYYLYLNNGENFITNKGSLDYDIIYENASGLVLEKK